MAEWEGGARRRCVIEQKNVTGRTTIYLSRRLICLTLTLTLTLAPMAVWSLWIADPRLRGLAINTLALSASSAAIAGAMGVPLALLLTRVDLPLRRAGLALAALLLFMPLYLHAAAWQAGWGMQGALLPLVGGQPLIPVGLAQSGFTQWQVWAG